jgi:uncharacterized membrane protein SirB2
MTSELRNTIEEPSRAEPLFCKCIPQVVGILLIVTAILKMTGGPMPQWLTNASTMTTELTRAFVAIEFALGVWMLIDTQQRHANRLAFLMFVKKTMCPKNTE